MGKVIKVSGPLVVADGMADANMAESSTSIVNSEIPCFTILFIKLLLIHLRPQKPALFVHFQG